ncbi:uncharacterized protein BP5553_07802 [Venustampulla echinocandica]|uniref:DUF2406 domain-containing protein n=1 Tax=Venustampulla echinocandica TaxID=2656787 RepID=A0A370THJ8_9HELO|nr:uncharacterized protein BP5553_07802 [Venustampulla echinocandica]RDL34674.1 hypothetical protein BP5553_07802 [Venustampulla echinocandica]
MAASHPINPVPAAAAGQYQRPAPRQRTKSTFSFRSQHSQKSSGSSPKIDLQETHREKESLRLNSKADPSLAMTEDEPAEVANQKSSLAPIRAIQHRDALGNPIADPDRSNPTRSRWERPLDTIRSFEAAIDGDYSRKSTYLRTASSDNISNYNRRSSYYGGGPNSYYGGRSQSYRPESTYADGRYSAVARPDSYYNGGGDTPGNGYGNGYGNGSGNGYGNGYHPNRARYPRTAPEQQFANGQGVYPVQGNQQSYETVTTASGSGSSDPAGYSTDPSSENSSVDRFAAAPPKEPVETYGFNGFGNVPQLASPGAGLTDAINPNGAYGSNGAQRPAYGFPNQAPPPPSKDVNGPRVPIKLGQTSGNIVAQPAQAKPATEKRKSWFGRRFSRA